MQQQETQKICLQEDCPLKGKRLSKSVCISKKHQTVTKDQVLKRVRALRANYQTDFKIKQKVFSELEQIYKKVAQIIKKFNDVMEQIQSQLYRYIELVKSSYQSGHYFQVQDQIQHNFDYKTVLSALEKAEKYRRIQFPYAEYPLERINSFNQVFQETEQIIKTEIQSMLDFFQNKMQDLEYTDFLKVKASGQLRFSKFLKNKVYEVSQDCRTIKRKPFEQQILNYQKSVNRSIIGTQISAIALVQKKISPQNPQITFRIKKTQKSSNTDILIGVINQKIAQQMKFSNCNSKGNWFSNFGKMFINRKQQDYNQQRYKNVSWSIDQGDEITMRLIKNQLTFTKKGTFFLYTAHLTLRPEDMIDIYPAVQIGKDTQIQIVVKQ